MMEYSAEELIPSIVVDVKDEREKVPLLLIGDLHLGHRNFNQAKFEKTLAWARDNKAYMIYMGDLVECMSNVKFGITAFEDSMLTIEKQREVIVDYLKPFGNRNLVLLTGNHEWRSMKYAGVNLAKLIAKEIGAIYAGWGTLLTLRFNETVDYGIAIHHGSSSSVYPQYELKRLDAIFEDYDILAIGHIHQLFHQVVQRLGRDEEGRIIAKDKHWIRTGSFLKYPTYAFKQARPVMKNGAPIVWLGTKNKEIHVDVSGAIH
ncbi:MAG: metallophosphoesterase [Candidatus Helarchaeales archaeon]